MLNSLVTTILTSPNGYMFFQAQVLSHSSTNLPPSSVLQPYLAPALTKTVGNKGKMTLEKEEKQVNREDCIGFGEEMKARRWSHSLRAGPQGIEYLMGGVEPGNGSGINVCADPEYVLSHYPLFERGQRE